MSYVKHSERTVRKPCKHCGRGPRTSSHGGLYWAHDTENPNGEPCERCGVDGKYTLIEQDGTRHNCQKKSGWSKIPTDPFTASQEVHKVTTMDDQPPFKAIAAASATKESDKVTATPDVQAALGLLAEALALGGPQVDRAEIEGMVKQAVANVVFPTRTVVERADGERKEIAGSQHSKLADVITCLMAEEHVMMVGPAGTGKSTIAEQAAEALSLPSYSISLSPQTPASQLLGYMQATGDYVPSLFRKAYETGGVFHFDEMDNAHPSVLAVINSALANGHMAFPDQMVKRHPDFRAIASANTYGRGANRAYVGRQAIDAATLDRFSIETIDVDESLENELCHSIGLETDQVERVLKFVRELRANVEAHSLPIVISPRASVGMCRLLAAGRSWESAVEARVRRGMGDTEWNKINK